MRKLLIFTCLTLTLLACKKTEEEPKVTPVPEDIEMKRITSAPWLMYKATANSLNIWDVGVIEPCQKDDTYKFYKDSSLMQYENANICSGNTDSTESYWSFYEGRKKLIGTILNITDTAEILLLDDNFMNVKIDYEGSPVVLYFKKN
ncbi:MAG: hypothetical protein JNM67_00230 [Bacteroidetes bacterium]|nr:hypothetical protein [Bacteroidota bacterium]